ncbi:MAG: hypothetical protein MUC35_02010 [Candidatus Margulisbacteria bacterium]|jgi:hypothetical protein|nr:hypothetical protein [Candidatus Margulisiibacteriota bacterium]
MWETAGTLASAAFGGAVFIHYLRNLILRESLPLAWDWDGLLERPAIAYIVTALPAYWYLVPVIVLIKLLVRLVGISSIKWLGRRREPGAAYQKVTLKAELAFELIASPFFAILVGVIF